MTRLAKYVATWNPLIWVGFSGAAAVQPGWAGALTYAALCFLALLVVLGRPE